VPADALAAYPSDCALIAVSRTLAPRAGYERHVVAYQSDRYNAAFLITIPECLSARLSGPFTFQHSDTDDVVPVGWCDTLAEELEVVSNRPRALHVYPRGNRNIRTILGFAMQCTVVFFDRYVKGNGE
jgi:hypothetical protein